MRPQVLSILVVISLTACSDPQPPAGATAPAATANASGLPVSITDLDATVAALETALKTQREIASRYPLAGRGVTQHLDPADHEALWQAAADEVESLETIVRIGGLSPDARQRVGEAYTASIGPAAKDTAKTIRRRGNFLGDAAPDQAAFDDFMKRRAAALNALVRMAFDAARSR